MLTVKSTYTILDQDQMPCSFMSHIIVLLFWTSFRSQVQSAHSQMQTKDTTRVAFISALVDYLKIINFPIRMIFTSASVSNSKSREGPVELYKEGVTEVVVDIQDKRKEN